MIKKGFLRKLFRRNKKNAAGFLNLFSLVLIFSIFLTSSCQGYDYYAAGKAAFNKSDYAKAGYYLNKALKKFPDNTKCRYYYAQVLVNQRQFKKAQKEYEKIIEKAPLSYEAKLSSIGISRIKKYQLIEKGGFSVSNIENASNINADINTKVRTLSIGDNYIKNAIAGSKVLRWHTDKMPIKLYVERATGVPGYKDYYYSTVLRAMNEWVNNAHGNIISYKAVNSPENADIQVYFVREIMRNMKENYVAGHAIPKTKRHILYNYEVKILTQKKPENRSFTEKEIYGTVLHELGHAFGIRGHSSDKRDIMYSGVVKDQEPGLSERDINTLSLLYTLDPDISNFDKGEKAVAHSQKNEEVLGTEEERLMNKLQEAMEYSEKYPDNVLSWVQLGEVYLNLKQYSNALISLNRALEINPNYPSAIENKAFVYQAMGDFSSASEQFKKLVEIDPDSINYSYNYALYLTENKQYDRAKEVLSNLKSLNLQASSDPDIMKLTKYLSQK